VPKLRGLVEICTNQKNVKAREIERAAREWRIASFTLCFVENVSADGKEVFEPRIGLGALTAL
jgi:hypothetical protein